MPSIGASRTNIATFCAFIVVGTVKSGTASHIFTCNAHCTRYDTFFVDAHQPNFTQCIHRIANRTHIQTGRDFLTNGIDTLCIVRTFVIRLTRCIIGLSAHTNIVFRSAILVATTDDIAALPDQQTNILTGTAANIRFIIGLAKLILAALSVDCTSLTGCNFSDERFIAIWNRI